MSVNSTSRRRKRRQPWGSGSPPAWLDAMALSLWGILFLKYWLNGKLNILIHPNYMWLTIAAGIVLLGISGLLLFKVIQKLKLQPASSSMGTSAMGTSAQHVTLFPPIWSSSLLVAIAILGFVIEPRAFASQTAIQRGLTDSLTMTRAKAQSFRSAARPEERTLIDWVRTLNAYPEPDAYTGQKVKVQGFVTYPPASELPDQYFFISRFVITCCAADVYPVGIPVKLSQSRSAYKPDTWLEVTGQMITETLGGRRQLTIQASTLKPIPEPKNPYDY
ncbi:MAG: TIGR03943 family protein [Leptolyngbyaceae bacterium]|nr:TIGR03943 family protein [Leptolyngbyaceae bacterium]